MPHELQENVGAIDLTATAPDRAELFRAVLAGVLDAVYGASPAPGGYEGRVVPVQAAGDDDDVLLADLVDDTLRAAREERGTPGAPRWLSFDERRVTATLPLLLPKAKGRTLVVSAARVSGAPSGWTARVELLLPVEA